MKIAAHITHMEMGSHLACLPLMRLLRRYASRNDKRWGAMTEKKE